MTGRRAAVAGWAAALAVLAPVVALAPAPAVAPLRPPSLPTHLKDGGAVPAPRGAASGLQPLTVDSLVAASLPGAFRPPPRPGLGTPVVRSDPAHSLPDRHRTGVGQGVTARGGAPGPRLDEEFPEESCSFPGRVYTKVPWGLERLLAARLRRYADGRGVRVAVIDSGVDAWHPQLRGAVLAGPVLLADGRGGSDGDPVGHGTMVAGIIAARPAPGTGVAGLAPAATIVSIRQNDAAGTGTEATLARAVDAAIAAHARVVNISQDLSSPTGPAPLGPDSPLAQAVARAIRSRAVVVAAAGNEGLALPTYPAALPGVLGVGASDRDDGRAAFSETGLSVSVAAPGVRVVSTASGGGHCAASGTSFAAPYAAAVAALLVQRHPDWSPAQVVARIERTARRAGPGRSPGLGWGVVDPVAALADPDPPGDDPSVPGVLVGDASTGLASSAGGSGRVLPRPPAADRTASRRTTAAALHALVVGGVLAVLTGATGAALVPGLGRRADAPGRRAGTPGRRPDTAPLRSRQATTAPQPSSGTAVTDVPAASRSAP